MLFSRPLIIVSILLLGALLVWQRLPAEPQLVTRTALIMGTLVEIRAFGEDETQVEQAISSAFAEMTRLEQLWSSHLPDSEISRLSKAKTEVQISLETRELLLLGRKFSRLSQGAFDMALGRVKHLWGVETDNPRIPGAVELRDALQGIGPESLLINGSRVSKSIPDLELDLGGLAKGYAVDRAVALLQQSGITSASVNAGGDIRLLGDKQGQPWKIGIQHPRKPGEILVALPLAGRAVVTSGDYERFFEVAGVRYHHLFDPRSGQPARGCQSVTVIAADAVSADALATAAFVLGPQEGLALLNKIPQVEGILVAADGERLVTRGLQDQIIWP